MNQKERAGPSTKDMVIGGIAFFALLFGLYIVLFLGPHGDKAGTKGAACMSNQKQLAYALLNYAADNDDTLPFRDGWLDAALATGSSSFDDLRKPMHPDVGRCAGLFPEHGDFRTAQVWGYSFNSLLDRAKLSSIKNPETAVLTFDSINLGRNASDPLTSLPTKPRHPKGNNISFVDGHVKRFPTGKKPN